MHWEPTPEWKGAEEGAGFNNKQETNRGWITGWHAQWDSGHNGESVHDTKCQTGWITSRDLQAVPSANRDVNRRYGFRTHRLWIISHRVFSLLSRVCFTRPPFSSTPISAGANTTWLVTSCPANQLPNISIHFHSGTRRVGGEGLAETDCNNKSASRPLEWWRAKRRRRGWWWSWCQNK